VAKRSRRRWWFYLLVFAGGLAGLVVLWLAAASVVYSPEYVRRVLAWGESDQGDYLDHFPLSPLQAASEPFRFADSTDEARVRAAFEPAFGVPDLEVFLAESQTQAFIVIKDDAVLYEKYFNGAERDSMLTSFSTAKSFGSTLIGIAIDEGFIGSVDDPITDYLPELTDRDSRFAEITIRDLLNMASGLDYQEMRWALFNGDDPLTTYYTNQREIALENTEIIDPSGEYFLYNKYHPQLLGLILERSTGMSVTEYTQTRLWDPLGMEFSGAWALDSVNSGFEKMEAGLNARAIDYAKLGRLFLDDGNWDGKQVVSADWVHGSVSLDPANDRSDYYPNDWGQEIYSDGSGYYNYMWYGRLRDGKPSDFAAEGDHGQFIYVSPAHHLIIVRNGTSYGESSSQWMDAFYAVAEEL
jgi:CubicO group peptidase (beta-lactamase class C family)